MFINVYCQLIDKKKYSKQLNRLFTLGQLTTLMIKTWVLLNLKGFKNGGNGNSMFIQTTYIVQQLFICILDVLAVFWI